MGKINTIYICNHAHTDIGFTDYQELALRQHGEFVGHLTHQKHQEQLPPHPDSLPMGEGR